MRIEAAVLVVSNRIANSLRSDESGKIAAQLLREIAQVQEVQVVPDDFERIREHLINWADNDNLDVILTVGGTGLSPEDVTPEATRTVIAREVPAIPQALMVRGLQQTPHAMLSRAVAGVRSDTLIINLPGNPDAVELYTEILLDVIPHALSMIRGGNHDGLTIL